MNRDDLQQILISLLRDAMGGPAEAARERDRDTGGEGEATAEAANPLRASGTVWGMDSLQRLVDATQAQTEKLSENTKALTETAISPAARITTALKGAIGGGVPGISLVASPLLSLASGLARLFGRGGEGGERAEPLRYIWPQELSVEAGLFPPDRTASAVDHDFEGRPRPIPAMNPPQVTVNVQAMDSRSFLDHSDEIARAVREAILNSHSLNEILTDL